MPGRKKNAFDPSAPRREQTTPRGRFADAWPPATDADRQALLKNVARAPMGYGTWRDLKALYKAVEQDALADPDPERADSAVLGALMGRIDAAPRTHASRQAPKARLDGVNLNGFMTMAALPDGRVVLVGYTYQNGTKRRFVLLAGEPADPLKPEVLGTLDLDYNYGTLTFRSTPGYLFVANQSYRTSGLEVIRVSEADEAGDGGGAALALHATHELPAGSGLLDFDCAVLPGDGGVRGALLVKTGGRRQEKAELHVLDLTPGGGGGAGPRTLGRVEINSANVVALSPDGRFAIVGTTGSGFSWSSLPKPGGLRVYDLADPAKPRQVGAMPLDNILAIRAGGPAEAPLAYVSVSRKSDRQPNGVHVVSLGTPAWPREVGFVALDQAPARLYGHPQRPQILFACQHWGGAILDVSNPAAPKVLKQGAEPTLNISAASGDILWTAEQYGGLSPWYLSDPAHPVRLGTPVSAATLGYMKRRVRRALEELAAKAPGVYAATAAQMLVSAGRTAANVSPADHWAAMEVLYGGGGRFAQKNHGRGAYVPVKGDAAPPRLSLRRREERHPEVWDAHPEAASTLAATKETPPEAREMALKVLRAGRHPLPSLNASTLERMLASGMPLQTALAVRHVADGVAGRRKISAAAAADAYRLAGSARKRRLEANLEAPLADPVWSANFVRHALKGLDERAEAAAAETPLSRRDAALLGLLFRATPRLFGMDAHRPLLAATLRRDDHALTALVLKNLEHFADPANTYAVLDAVRGLPGPQRDAVVDALARGLAARASNGFTANYLGVFSQVDPWLCRASWRILAAGTAPAEFLAQLWRRILAATEPTDAVRAALGSPDALTALAQSGIPTDEVAAALTERPFLVALLSPETFADVLRRTPPAVALQIIAAAPDEQWARLRPALVRALAEGFGGAPFWAAIPEAMENDPEERLAARLLAEGEIAGTFLEIADVETVLEIREPAFGPLLARWAARYVAELPRDSVTLLTAATHELPEVRSAGLARVRSVGMGLPFALGLLESEVPPSVEAGREFFEADRTDDGDRAYPYALALLDSPRASVREWGRGYAAGRLHRVSHASLCRALFENPNPDVQAFAADLAAGGLSGGEPPTEAAGAGEPLNPAQTAQFDAEVLRQRNRSRRAKEKIKARQSAAPAPTVDVATLLALARGADGTARDAEWALAQLARLALSGQPVEGLTLEAVPGADGAPAAGRP